MVDEEVRRVLRLLETTMKASGLSHGELERRIGVKEGYLAQLFSGGAGLELRHILLIIEELGLDPSAFFHLAYPERSEHRSGGRSIVDELLAGFQRLGYTVAPPAARTGAAMEPEALRELIKSTIREVFGERSPGPGGEPGEPES